MENKNVRLVKRVDKPSAVRKSRRAALASIPALALLTTLQSRTASAADAVTTRKPEIGSFDRILVEIPADVTVVIGSPAAISITAETKVLEVIEAEVTDGQLAIRTNGSFQTQKPVTIEISAPELIALDALGSCDVTVNGPLGGEFTVSASDASTISLLEMNLESLTADLQGSSEVTATGSADELQLTVAGSSSFTGADLAVMAAHLEVGGASEATVDVEEKLAVTITDAASVYYAGSPEIEKSVSFAGTLEAQ